MDSEELIKRCRAIKLSDEEEGRVTFRSKMKAQGEKIVASCLIRKVIHTRGVSIEGLKVVMQRVWKLHERLKLKVWEKMFLCSSSGLRWIKEAFWWEVRGILIEL
ncbi:hypothetical protein AB3S75_034960 [Citrus x aurantiifolia]